MTPTPDAYAAEVEARWGGTEQWRESQRRTSSYDETAWVTISAERAAIEDRFAAAMASGRPADDAAVAGLVEEHRAHISRWFYECTPAMHRVLAETYVADERFAAHFDERVPGLAAYVSAAILAER